MITDSYGGLMKRGLLKTPFVYLPLCIAKKVPIPLPPANEIIPDIDPSRF